MTTTQWIIFTLVGFSLLTISYYSFMAHRREEAGKRRLADLSHDTVYAKNLTRQDSVLDTVRDRHANYDVDGVSYDQDGTIVSGDGLTTDPDNHISSRRDRI